MFVLKRYYPVGWFICLTVLASAAAYYRLCTGFSPWDDEGTLMLSVQRFLLGHPLYTEVWTAYGPVYYFYNWALHALSGAPVTHDFVRIAGIIPSVVCPLISAWYIFRLTQSMAIAAATHFFTFSALWFFSNEPGHPQELSVVLLVCFIAAGYLIPQQHLRLSGLILMGGTAAALCLVKVNVGVFVIIAAVLAFAFHLPDSRWSRVMRTAGAGVAVILPVILMRSRFDDKMARIYCLIVVASTLAMLFRLLSIPRPPSITFRDCWITAGCFVAVLASVVFFLSMNGLSSVTLLNSLLLDNVNLSVTSRAWYAPPTLRSIWIPWSVAGVAAVTLANWFERSSTRWTTIVFSVIRISFGLGAAWVSLIHFWSPADGWALFQRLTLLGVAPPFAWLALGPPAKDVQSIQSFPRTLLCASAITQTLYAFPIAGSQIEFIKIPLILVAAISVADGTSSLATAAGLSFRMSRLAAASLLAGIAVSYFGQIHLLRKQYDSLPPLSAPGAQRIHVDPRQARDYQSVAANVNRYCDSLFGLPGLPSFNVWTGKDSLTRYNFDAWMLNITPEQQASVQADLSERPNACIIYNPDLVSFWNRTGISVEAMPLVRYIRTNFKTAVEIGHYYLLVKNGRSLNPQ